MREYTHLLSIFKGEGHGLYIGLLYFIGACNPIFEKGNGIELAELVELVQLHTTSKQYMNAMCIFILNNYFGPGLF